MKHSLATALIACTVVAALEEIRPGAQWNLKEETYDGLEWIDATQAKPSRAEIVNAVQDCRDAEAARLAAKRAARYTVRLSTATALQKVNAMILLMELDK